MIHYQQHHYLLDVHNVQEAHQVQFHVLLVYHNIIFHHQMVLLHVLYVMINVHNVEVDQHVLNVKKDIMFLLDYVQNVVLIIVMYVLQPHQQLVQHVQMDISYYHQLQMV